MDPWQQRSDIDPFILCQGQIERRTQHTATPEPGLLPFSHGKCGAVRFRQAKVTIRPIDTSANDVVQGVQIRAGVFPCPGQVSLIVM